MPGAGPGLRSMVREIGEGAPASEGESSSGKRLSDIFFNWTSCMPKTCKAAILRLPQVDAKSTFKPTPSLDLSKWYLWFLVPLCYIFTSCACLSIRSHVLWQYAMHKLLSRRCRKQQAAQLPTWPAVLNFIRRGIHIVWRNAFSLLSTYRYQRCLLVRSTYHF